MPKRTTRKTDAWKAYGSDMNYYWVYEYTDYIETEFITPNPQTVLEGRKSYRLDNGTPVNYLSDTEEFEIAGTNIKLMRD